MAHPGIPKKVRSASFEKAQIIGVVDHAREIGVFIIDPDIQPMLSVLVEGGR